MSFPAIEQEERPANCSLQRAMMDGGEGIRSFRTIIKYLPLAD
jgi:hypothetical protein